MLKKLAIVPDSFFIQDGKKLSLLAYLFLVVLCVGFFTPGLVTMPPTDRDESSFAQASKQMIETSNYTDIRLQDAPRYKKPIGIYWLQTTAVRILAPHNLDEIWAYRIPSFVGATIAVLLTAALGALFFNPMTGLMAAVMLASCVLMNVEARLATTDGALLACVMAAMLGMARVYLEKTTRCSWQTFFLFWTAIAFGILLKGPIILLPVASVLLWIKISEKNIQWFRNLRPLPGLIYALVLVAPWFIAIMMQSHGAFMQQSAGHDLLAKIWQGQNRGIVPPGMYIIFFPITFFPFALFTTFATPDAWKNRGDPAIRFCLGWIIPTWVIFELSMTKLPHYVLPTYPAIALLTAKFLMDGFPTIANTSRRFPIVLIIAFWLMTGMGMAFVFAVAPSHIDGQMNYTQIVASGILILMLGMSLLLLPRHKPGSVVVLALGSLIFLSSIFGFMLPGLQHAWMSREIVDAVTPVKPCSPSQIVSVGYHEPSLVFLGGTDTIMAADGSDAAKALKENGCRVAVVTEKNKQEFIDSFADSRQKPREAGAIGGLNSGHGSEAFMTIYVMSPAVP